jgi:membrane-bound metal-dependent hydrolase YbcI (DUF457 family)
MRLAYYAVAAPVALGTSWTVAATQSAPWPVAVAAGLLILASSTWPGLVDPRYKGRMNPAAALVRGSAHLGYMVRTPKDQDRSDLNRGPTYCVEWCAVVGVLVALLATLIPPLAGWAWWWGAAAFLGCLAHVLADWATPTGVPLSVVWNYFRHGEMWRRHSLGWFTTDSAGDMFLAVPALFVLTGVMGLAMLGWLSPVLRALTGWGS